MDFGILFPFSESLQQLGVPITSMFGSFSVFYFKKMLLFLFRKFIFALFKFFSFLSHHILVIPSSAISIYFRVTANVQTDLGVQSYNILFCLPRCDRNQKNIYCFLLVCNVFQAFIILNFFFSPSIAISFYFLLLGFIKAESLVCTL